MGARKGLAGIRLQRGETQEQVASAIGISRARYSHYERGIRRVPVSMLPRLAEHFGITVDELLRLIIVDDDSSGHDDTEGIVSAVAVAMTR